MECQKLFPPYTEAASSRARLCTVACTHLGKTNLLESTLSLDLVDTLSGSKHEESRLVDLGTGLGNVNENGAVFHEDLAECLALGVGDAEEHHVEGTRGDANSAHAVVDTARAKTSLEHLEATAKVTRATGDGSLEVKDDVLVNDLAVTFGGVVVAEHLHWADDLNAGGFGVDKEDGVTLVLGGVFGVGLRDDNVDGAAGVTSSRDPPLVSVEDELVAITTGNSVAQVGSVRRGDSVLGHREGGTDLAFDKGHEVLVLLSLGAKAGEDLHVSSVGGRAVHGLGHDTATVTGNLGNDGVLEVGETSTRATSEMLELTAREPEVPETDLLGASLERLENWGDDLPAVGSLADLLVVKSLGRHAVVLEERDGGREHLETKGGEVGLNLGR